MNAKPTSVALIAGLALCAASIATADPALSEHSLSNVKFEDFDKDMLAGIVATSSLGLIPAQPGKLIAGYGTALLGGESAAAAGVSYSLKQTAFKFGFATTNHGDTAVGAAVGYRF